MAGMTSTIRSTRRTTRPARRGFASIATSPVLPREHSTPSARTMSPAEVWIDTEQVLHQVEHPEHPGEQRERPSSPPSRARARSRGSRDRQRKGGTAHHKYERRVRCHRPIAEGVVIHSRSAAHPTSTTAPSRMVTPALRRPILAPHVAVRDPDQRCTRARRGAPCRCPCCSPRSWPMLRRPSNPSGSSRKARHGRVTGRLLLSRFRCRMPPSNAASCARCSWWRSPRCRFHVRLSGGASSCHPRGSRPRRRALVGRWL